MGYIKYHRKEKILESIITCKDLTKEFNLGKESVQVLKGINLDIKKGEFISLLGKSGSGKSTLLNLLAGLEKPTEGEITLKGHRIEKLSETGITNIRKKHIGFIFQSYNLLAGHTALSNVMLPMIFNGVPKTIRIERAKKMLEAVDLADRMYHLPNQMSGGQQQRVSIARAFVNNPEIIFADEPTGNLDSKTTKQVMDLMMQIINENNQTMVMVTHDPDTSKFSDRIFHMKDGLIDNIIENKRIILGEK